MGVAEGGEVGRTFASDLASALPPLDISRPCKSMMTAPERGACEGGGGHRNSNLIMVRLTVSLSRCQSPDRRDCQKKSDEQILEKAVLKNLLGLWP